MMGGVMVEWSASYNPIFVKCFKLIHDQSGFASSYEKKNGLYKLKIYTEKKGNEKMIEISEKK